MAAYREQWEAALNELETDREGSLIAEQHDGTGIELPSLYRLIISQAANACYTEAWKKRTCWVGYQVTGEMTESITNAEKHLQAQRPVRRRHGKLLEEGC